ncbi:MAG: hypothetical protein IKC09_03415 [Oscillospiraceae bacterium]|nr:hypothetical protein [Oscillospiraceae bacterium]
MDVVVDFISVFIVDPICDFLRGKFTFQAWAKNAGLALLMTLLLVACVGATAWFWYTGIPVLSVFFGLLAAVLLILDSWRNSRWRKESKKDE